MPPRVPAAVATDYVELCTLLQLKSILKERGLPVTGTKALLAARLVANDNGVDKCNLPKAADVQAQKVQKAAEDFQERVKRLHEDIRYDTSESSRNRL